MLEERRLSWEQRNIVYKRGAIARWARSKKGQRKLAKNIQAAKKFTTENRDGAEDVHQSMKGVLTI